MIHLFPGKYKLLWRSTAYFSLSEHLLSRKREISAWPNANEYEKRDIIKMWIAIRIATQMGTLIFTSNENEDFSLDTLCYFNFDKCQ